MLRGFESLTRHGDHLDRTSPPGEDRSERSHGGTNCQSDSDLPRIRLVAPIAQSAERLHGKEKVKGSIPFRGSHSGGQWPPLCSYGEVAQLVRAHDS